MRIPTMYMSYKGYKAKVNFSEEDGLYVGEIINIPDIVSFHGENLKEIRKFYEEAVDSYLEVLKKMWEELT